MNYSKQQKLEFIKQFQNSNLTIDKFCDQNKISRSAFGVWRKNFDVTYKPKSTKIYKRVNDKYVVSEYIEKNFIEILPNKKQFFDSNFQLQLGDLKIASENPISHDDFKVIIEILGVKNKC